MADPAAITAEALEILVARDLRKAGLRLTGGRRLALTTADGSDELRLDLEAAATAAAGAPPSRLRIECHRRPEPAGEAEVRGAAQRVEGGDGGGGDGAPVLTARAIVVSASGFTPAALAAGGALGIPLLRVADARSAFDASGWGPRGQYPSWLPEYVLELATTDPAGAPRYEMLREGMAARLLGG